MVATEGDGEHAGTCALAAADVAAGGRALRTMTLVAELFAADGEGGLTKDLMAMTVTELREELDAREEPVSGNKAWLCCLVVVGTDEAERLSQHRTSPQFRRIKS